MKEIDTMLYIGMAAWLLFCVIVLVGLVAVPAPAHSQGPQCGPLVALERSLAQIKEKLVAVGHGSRQMRLYVDPDGRGWTVLAISPDGTACAVFAGHNFDLVRQAPAGKST